MTIRLHSRLVFWTLLVVTVIFAVLGYFITSSVRGRMQDEIQERLRREIQVASAYIDLDADNRASDELAGELSERLSARVSIIGLDGKVLGDSDVDGPDLDWMDNQSTRPEIEGALQQGTGYSIRESGTTNDVLIFAASRVDSHILRLAVPITAVDRLISGLILQLALATVIAMGVTLLFGYGLRGLSSVPLRELSAASRKLAAGDFKQRLPISGDDEIATLGNSLNTMAKTLDARMHELSDGKQRLELIVGAMREGVMVLDSAGRISLTNRSIQRIVDNERNLTGMTVLDVFRRPELDAAVKRVMAGETVEAVELTAVNNRVLQANIAPVVNASGVTDSVVVVFHDLTDIRRAEKMRRDFVANVSHEFKTPLTSIRGYAETLLSGAADDRQVAADFLGTIERNARHLETLVSDLLVLARLEAELPAQRDTVDIRTLIDEHLAFRKSVIMERGVRVTNDCPAGTIPVDQVRLAAALSNLIDNAIHYNRPGGEIQITGSFQQSWFELRISDTGKGIPSEDLPRIFERFYRVDKARSRESGGTGLGLSIVKHAIESQGGMITVSSRPGVGTTFAIKLPI